MALERRQLHEMAHRPTSVKSLPLKSMPALVLLNPHAQGGRAARRAPMLQRWLMQNAPHTEFAAPDSVPDALRWAAPC
jgi:hypothetical protein